MSSDDESSGSSSDESEDIQVTGLVATRAKRGNAGNLYESLRAHLDDEDLQKELLAEDEADDAEDYEGSDADDDNDALDSSSDEDDAGPSQAGEAEDLAGEKELLKAERAEKSKKRKAQAAKLVVPAFKKVKLADQVTADDGSVSPIEGSIKKKKLVRVEAEGPKRQSIRSSAIANREVIQANLEESAVRAQKQKDSSQETVKKERANRRVELTLEQRLEKCKRIEKETAKELGRFEREEAERVRLREEALLAKRRRVLDGPLIRTLTTSGYYENGKLKVKRLLHGSQQLDDVPVEDPLDENEGIVQVSRKKAAQQAVNEPDAVAAPSAGVGLGLLTVTPAGETAIAERATPSIVVEKLQQADIQPSDQPEMDVEMQDVPVVLTRVPELESLPAPIHPDATPTYYPSSPTVTGLLSGDQSAPGSGMTSMIATPAEPAAPVIREQAQRKLVMLESFESLETANTRRTKAAAFFEPTPIAQILMPESYPSLTDEQMLYLRKPKKSRLEDPTSKPACALTGWPGKYRDPRTGVVYADNAQYKMLQRMIAGGFTWNSMLECWVGPAYGAMGRPARGVPPGFDNSAEIVEIKQES